MLANPVAIQTITRELAADLETPISVFLKLRGKGPSFLLESVEGGENIARYSFIGIHPRRKYTIVHGNILVQETGLDQPAPLKISGRDPILFLQQELAQFQIASRPGLPRFIGGLAGYLGYECVRYFEPHLAPRLPDSTLPDGIFLLCDTILAFDHVRRSLFLIAHALDGDEAAAQCRLDDLEQALRAPLPAPRKTSRVQSPAASSNRTRPEFERMVQAAKEHIAAGDIFQVVLSQRFTRQTQADPFEIYRAVRRLNPSPYMFFFDFGPVEGKPLYLVGASPEMLVRLEDRTACLRPIAGTRRRGDDMQSDAALAAELLADPKERAEHVMLVDLGRNDLGRVCEYGSIHVPEFFTIERYSHVMHLVSHVEGRLRPGLGAFDLVRAAFPAGTVSGAPKVRAMEIISELEEVGRGPYAGMVGYFGFDGALDTCLAIRTLVAHGSNVSVQAGAGIVADSDPAAEYQETLNKAQAMLKAIEIVENEYEK